MYDFRTLFRGLALLLALTGGVPAALAANVVGEVSMVIGVGRVLSSDGENRMVSRGMTVRVGDRIETEAGGHVHIRFVDGGMVSVRPLSRLQIEDYRHDQQASLSAIKFRLDQGVMRSVTGHWGEAARDRFRLNTPIAAIGIKGTDFVVKVDGDTTFASVLSGAIVMAPLEGGCQATLGPCQVEHARLLSAEMRGQMLEISRQQNTPRLVPATDLLVQGDRKPVVTVDVRHTDKSQLAVDESGADRLVSSDARAATTASATLASNDARAATAVSATLASNDARAAPTAPTTTAPTKAVSPALPAAELVMVRWPWAPPYGGDNFSRDFDSAVQAGLKGVLGNGSYSIYRAQADAPPIFTPVDTAANFRLTNAAAQLARADGGLEAVKVSGGSLKVDFARSTFNTQVGLSNPTIGATSLNASGLIDSNGIFRSQPGGAFLAGAFSSDGLKAGYLFEQAVTQGQISGITLWGR